jgi:hypothetical protein
MAQSRQLPWAAQPSSAFGGENGHCRDASRFCVRMTTFDPMDAGIPNPPVYITSSLLFRGEMEKLVWHIHQRES